MTKHSLAGTMFSTPWTAKRYRRLLMLATISPMLGSAAFKQLKLQDWSWPTDGFLGIGLAALVILHANATRARYLRLWMALASLSIAFWALAVILNPFPTG
jgi:hypothetical protein